MQHQRDRPEELSPAETLIAYEHETWSLIKCKDLEGFASYLAEDFYDIFPDGKERTKLELLEFLRGADLKEYAWWKVVERLRCRFGPTSARSKIEVWVGRRPARHASRNGFEHFSFCSKQAHALPFR